jgi:ribosomal protein S18 acetylase RimI-like enzyme
MTISTASSDAKPQPQTRTADVGAAAPPGETFEFDVEDLRADHAAQLADLHERCFPGYFLTLMGRGVLKRYYAEFARHPFDFGCAARARSTGELIALAVGSADVSAHTRSFVRRNFFYLVVAVGYHVAVNRQARQAVFERAGRLVSLVRWLSPARCSTAQTPQPRPEDDAPVRFLSMGIDPSWRRSLASIAVVRRFEQLLRDAGHRRFGSSIFADNERAISFFTRMRYRVVKRTDAAVWLEKDLSG